ncbi:hypothetical protein K435DRAFT_840901 [Dendrothele bispora CBS 962.96]|uniref:Uncharacterized protein n=1 Tax=Dendrothele bispora (strain CBS 962.96) TaxID=1314807 RepID=A0A4S8LQL1_DENBC|nr:hypothetical protein K435DRAFT_840901 [Dendrothele bispora CBS 962.96]
MSDHNGDQVLQVEDHFVDIDNIHILLKALDQGSLDNLARATTYVGTATKGSFDDKLPANVVRESSVKLGQDQGYYLFHSCNLIVKFRGEGQLEVAVTIVPRAQGGFKNAPDGNVVHKCYKDPFDCPVGVTIKQKGTDIFKKVELDGKEWSCLVWENSFEPGKESAFEYFGVLQQTLHWAPSTCGSLDSYEPSLHIMVPRDIQYSQTSMYLP